jgi:dipeptidyl aminopeptidase/acylaminoacyl peptidase
MNIHAVWFKMINQKLRVPLTATVLAIWSAAPSPTELAPGVISTGHEFTVTFTPDQCEVYFTRFSSAPRWYHVMHSVWRDGAWQRAQAVPFSGDAWADMDPALSLDGQRLYFVSTRPTPEGRAGATALWYVDRIDGRWSDPHWIATAGTEGHSGSPTVDRAGSLCFFSDRGQPGHNRIFCAAPANKEWSTPEALDSLINAGPSDTSPWLSPDGQSLLFYSERSGGRGKADLYVSERRGGVWGAPRNLGPAVNTDSSEYNPSLSPDGSILFFGRNGRIYAMPASATALGSRGTTGLSRRPSTKHSSMCRNSLIRIP